MVRLPGQVGLQAGNLCHIPGKPVEARRAGSGEETMKSRLFKTRAGAELKVSEMGFGAAPLGDLFELIDERVAYDTLRTAHEAGVTLFDASPHYGNGLAEARCGTALRGLTRDSFVFSTKVGRVMHPFEPPAPKDPNVYSPGFLGGFPHGVQVRLFLRRRDALGGAVAAAHGAEQHRHAADPRRRRLDPRRQLREALRRGDGRRLQGARRAAPHGLHQGDRRRRQRGRSRRRGSPRKAISTPCCWPGATRCWSSPR